MLRLIWIGFSGADTLMQPPSVAAIPIPAIPIAIRNVVIRFTIFNPVSVVARVRLREAE